MTDDVCMTDTVLTTAKPEYPVTVEMVETLVDMAGYGINYWAGIAIVDTEAQTYTVEPMAEFPDQLPKKMTYLEIAEGIAKLAFDDTVQVTPYIRDYARSTLIEQDGGCIDAEMADVVIQLVMFGEIVFG